MVSRRSEVPVFNSSLDLAKSCALVADEKKAQNISVLDVSRLTSFADFFVLSSASSERQAQAIAKQVIDTAKKAGMSPLGVEGQMDGHWILVDLGDVVVHVFTSEARDYYDLDGLWADAPVLPFVEAAPKGKAKLTLAPLCES